MFRNFPPRFILQTLASLTKHRTADQRKKIIPKALITKLEKYIPFNFEKINLALTSEEILEKELLNSFGIDKSNCNKKGSCAQINKIVGDIGSLLLDFD